MRTEGFSLVIGNWDADGAIYVCGPMTKFYGPSSTTNASMLALESGVVLPYDEAICARQLVIKTSSLISNPFKVGLMFLANIRKPIFLERMRNIYKTCEVVLVAPYTGDVDLPSGVLKYEAGECVEAYGTSPIKFLGAFKRATTVYTTLPF